MNCPGLYSLLASTVFSCQYEQEENLQILTGIGGYVQYVYFRPSEEQLHNIQEMRNHPDQRELSWCQAERLVKLVSPNK